MRELTDVIERLLDYIPYDQKILRSVLSQYIDCPNTIENWNDVGDILYLHVFSDFYPEVGWQEQVEKIWIGDEDQDMLDFSNF